MRVKALFLLTIFLLNTTFGFCCTLNLVHEDHDEVTAHHHEQHPGFSLGLDHQKGSLSTVLFIHKNDPCCQGAVNNFASLAKLMPQPGKSMSHAPVVYIAPYFQFLPVNLSGVKSHHQISIEERQRPPTQNIRIVIQSFQI
ncbi:hypothetical protein ACPPVU_17780 [Mucilaginibacter sp. McL0603]|uniref:hypothetical protein n=1 Tax=Mucilaginibacter sp. McL0603 TaxID=3415670 RepID=UPI003CE9EF36